MDEENPGTMETSDTQRDDPAIMQMEMTSDDCVAGHSRESSKGDDVLLFPPSNNCTQSPSEADYSAHKIDVLSRILFPVLFV